MADRYLVNEIFWSPQGEGLRAGEMSAFIRFKGCNMKCAMEAGPKSPGGFDCDTEFESGRSMTAEEIVAAIDDMSGQGALRQQKKSRGYSPWVVLTGGEPGLQVDDVLVGVLHNAGWRIAIETNGSVDLSGLDLDWITVSPKVAEHAIRQTVADEVKYVRGYGQALPKPTCRARYQLISPAFNGLTIDQKAFEWCLGLIREDPSWRLSVQMHKPWMVR
jgi:7-carboxy-7-deazaguanine synthase